MPRNRVAGPRHRRPPARRPSRGRWLFLSLVMVVIAAALLIEGYTRGTAGETAQTVAQNASAGQPAPAAVRSGGPVIDAAGARAFSYRVPARTVALTFDDGPDPTWTPKILAVLRRYHVPATFNTVGSRVAAHPGLVRAELRSGDEVGSHTYTHASPAGAGWGLGLQLGLTQSALAGAAGIRTALMRPPYSSLPDAVTAAQWAAYQRISRDGYLIELASLDSRDWARPGVAHIVAAATPRGGRGAVIMLHDAGGNRSQTVAALPQIIMRLRARGYRFATVTGALGLPSADVPATRAQHLAGLAVLVAQQSADYAGAVLGILLVAATVLIVARLWLLLGFAHLHWRRTKTPRRSLPHPLPGVSIVVPAYNEAAGIAATVTSLTASRYDGDIEVIVVDDGSADGTAGIVRNLAISNVRVITQPNAGKPAALNRGIAAARHDILVLVDGDTVFEPGTLAHLVQPMADPAVGAVSGNTKVGNRTGLLGRWQHLEYVMGFNLDRRVFDMLGAISTVPGAVGAFRRAALAQAGGLYDGTLAEDTDLTMAISRAGWKVTYEASAIAWTEAPATVRQLWKQRYRWSYGTMQAMWRHRRALTDPGPSGRYGRRCLTYLTVFHILLPLIAPIVDIALIYGLLFQNPLTVAVFWLAFAVLQILACGFALRWDRERLGPLWALPLQQVLYRQLMYLVTIQSVTTALLGTRQRWQAIPRAGVFSAAPTSPSPVAVNAPERTH